MPNASIEFYRIQTKAESTTSTQLVGVVHLPSGGGFLHPKHLQINQIQTIYEIAIKQIENTNVIFLDSFPRWHFKPIDFSFLFNRSLYVNPVDLLLLTKVQNQRIQKNIKGLLKNFRLKLVVGTKSTN